MSNPDSAIGDTNNPYVSMFENGQGNTIGALTVNNVKGDQHVNYGPSSEFNIKKIREWLAAPDSSSNYINACDKRTENTGMWLVNDARFHQWKSNGGILWLQGQAGSGKTFLCSNVITCLKKEYQEVFYHYFDTLDASKAKTTYKGLVANLLIEMGTHNSFNQATLRNLFNQHGMGNKNVSVSDMQDAVLALVSTFSGETYIILDAMDECLEGKKVAEFIQTMLQLGQMHIMISCRHPMPQYFTDPQFSVDAKFSLDKEERVEDIEKHIESFLVQNARLFKNIEDEIKGSLMMGAHGQIRWVDCQLEVLKNIGTRKAIRAALQKLPKTLVDTYQQALETIDENHRDEAKSILQWVLFSFESVTIEMASEILAIDVKRQKFSEEDCTPGLECSIHKVIPSMLVKVIDMDYAWKSSEKHLQLAHPSVKEFLIDQTSTNSQFYVNDQLAHEFLAQSCIIYWIHHKNETGKRERTRYQLGEYAVRYWTEHAASVEKPTDLSIFVKFLDSKSGPYIHWIHHYNVEYGFMQYEPDRRIADPLYVVCLRSLIKVAGELLDQGADVNAQGGEYGNALQAAVKLGNEAFVKLLLEKGADVNAQGGEYGSALQAALQWSNEAIVKLLLEKGADVNAQGGENGSALLVALQRRDFEAIVKLLVEKGADVNAQGGRYGNTLQAAVQYGNEAIVKLLLEKGADVNAQGGHYVNALQAAVQCGNEAIVKLLLEKGADVNAQGGKYGNALQAAEYEGNEAIVKLLLEKGADVNAQAGEYGNALQAASCGDNETIVRLLLEKGADVNAQGGKYGNALQAASCWGSEAIVKLLLEKGADLNNQSGKYGSALQAAVQWGNEGIVKLLLDKGADVNIQAGEYGNALQAASCWGSETTVKLLLEKGADINAQGGKYGNALQAASYKRNGAIVKLLLEKGANVNAQGGEYGNALNAARGVHFLDRHQLTEQLLLAYGAHEAN